MKTFLRKSLLGGVAAAIFTLTAAAFAAEVPQTLTHQGRLYDAAGAPVTGAKDLVFSVYDAVDASTPIILFTHDQPDVEAKHFINPNGAHDINADDQFENLLADQFIDGPSVDTLSTLPCSSP